MFFLSRFVVVKCPMQSGSIERSKSIGRHPVPRVAQRTSAKCASLVVFTRLWSARWRLGNLLSDESWSVEFFSRRDCELSVSFCLFFPPCHMCHPQGCSHSSLFVGSRLGALGTGQNQSFWHLGVMFTVLWRHPLFIGLFG